MATGISPPISPLATNFPKMETMAGVHLKTRACGLRYQGRDDVSAIVFDEVATIAAVFTRNQAPGAPIDWNRQSLQDNNGVNNKGIRAIITNAGNANAFTGQAGRVMCDETAAAAAEILQCEERQIYLASTGVIGEKPPPDYLSRHLPPLLASKDCGWQEVAAAISTTDTFPKGYQKHMDWGGEKITISGVAKGSGMIAPDMATMLCFIVTDANLPQPLLQKALAAATDDSFNNLTVDSDCSTSDMVLLAALGSVGDRITETSPLYHEFIAGLREVMVVLAKSVAADGEGAKKFITITVQGARTRDDARTIALSVGNSPLVKTAIAGEDANWGRVVMAVGKSGIAIDRDRLDIRFGDIAVAANGERVDNYDEAAVDNYMKNSHIDIVVNVNLGDASAEIWTCDLTYDYIRINADYRS